MKRDLTKHVSARRFATKRIAHVVGLGTLLAGAAPLAAVADEGGVSFWLPGLFGSMVAVPGAPGWSFDTIYIAPHLSGGGSREFNQGGGVTVGLQGVGSLFAFGPAYTLPDSVLGGQLTVSLSAIAGQNVGRVDATFTGPGGSMISGARSDVATGFGDLLPQAMLKWNSGVNNYMAYLTGDIPVGSYDPERLANLGLGHGAIDGGLGYTYFNPATGHEFSIAGGLTYNLENSDTDYQNGIDAHIDWAASQFLSKQWQVGVNGYFFQQLTADSGSGATLGSFRSGAIGIGPQASYYFPVNDAMQGVINAKVDWDLTTQNRPKGWTAWVTFALLPIGPQKP